jgi:hypothetical protein
MQSYDS